DVSGAADQRITGAISGLSTQTVRLRLMIDPAKGTAQGFYSTDGTTYKNVGETYSTPSLSISGMGLTSSTANTGIYATHRKGSTAVTYTFENFLVSNPVNATDPASSTPLISNIASSS